MVIEKQLLEELQRIVALVNSTEILRMGKIFSTEKNNYFYDTGTGKVIELDDESYYVFYNWFHQTGIVAENFVNDLGVNEKNLSELLKLCIMWINLY